METKKTAVLLASLVVMSSIAVMMIASQSASATQAKDDRCLPRSEFNGKDNAGNEHFNGDGSFDQPKNPHDEGTPAGNPHDRCPAGEGS